MCEMPWEPRERTVHPLSTEVITRQSKAASSYKQARLPKKLCRLRVGTEVCLAESQSLGLSISS